MFATLKILLLETDVVSRVHIRNAIEELGHEVLEAGDTETAMDMIFNQRPHILIVDWTLEEMSGVDFVQRLKERHPPQMPYVILLTAQQSVPIVPETLGVDDFLTKPFRLPDLIARIAVAAHALRLRNELDQVRRRIEQAALLEQSSRAFNRRAIYQWLKREFARSHRQESALSVLLVGFAEPNEWNSLANEDQQAFLDHLLRMWTLSVRGYDSIGKWDDAHYLFVLPGTTLEQALVVAHRLKEVTDSMTWTTRDGRLFRPTFVCAVATVPEMAFSSVDGMMEAVERLLTLKDAPPVEERIYVVAPSNSTV